MTQDENGSGYTLPAAYSDEGFSFLELVLRERVERDSPFWTYSTLKGNRQALNRILPIAEHVGAYTLEQLGQPDLLLEFRTSLSEVIVESGLAPGTWAEYIAKFGARCAAAGMAEDAHKRLCGAMKQARKMAKQPIETEPELTPEHLRSILSVMSAWAEAPTRIPVRRGGSKEPVCYTLPAGYQGRPMTGLRRDRVLAFAAFQLSGALRTSSVIELLRKHVRGRTVRFMVVKGRVDPLWDTFDLSPVLEPFAQPLLRRVTDDEARLFNRTSSIVQGDLRVLLLEAGIPEHYGRTGLHRVRKALVKSNYDAGLSAAEASAGLTNTPGVAEKSYAVHTRGDQAKRSRQAWLDLISEATTDPPEWRFEGEGMAWNALPSWARVIDPLDLGPGLLADLPEGTDTSSLHCLWRMRYVQVQEDDDGSDWWEDGWRRYACYESVQGDVVIPWHTRTGTAKNPNGGLTVSTMKPLWLQHGGMHSRWWACLDLNQGLLLPKQQA